MSTHPVKTTSQYTLLTHPVNIPSIFSRLFYTHHTSHTPLTPPTLLHTFSTLIPLTLLGVYEFDNAIALFINCFEEGGADRAPASMRKYANQFLLGGDHPRNILYQITLLSNILLTYNLPPNHPSYISTHTFSYDKYTYITNTLYRYT